MSAIPAGSKKRYLQGIPNTGSVVDNHGIPEYLKTLQDCMVFEISVSARDLRCADRFSKSDPICILSVQEDSHWKEMGMTEVIMNNCSPEFVKKFYVGKRHDESKQLKFQLYDVDGHNDRPYIKEGNFLGQFQCSLQKLVSNLKLEGNLKSYSEKDCQGHITVIAELQSAKKKQKENLNFTLKVTDVKGAKKCYMCISKRNEDRFIPVYRTETVTKCRGNLEWNVNICILVVSNYNDERDIKFECFEDKNGNDKSLGHFTIHMGRLKRLQESDSVKFEPPEKSDKPMTATIKDISTTSHPTFLDFIDSGMKIMLSFAVDFTVSNKEYHHRPMGHSTGDLSPSLYARAMKRVGEILSEDLRVKKIAAYGMGAVLSDGCKVHNAFALNKKSTDPACNNILDVIECYNETLKEVTLKGPTCFEPVIQCVCRKVSRSFREGPLKEYHILVIFTDGEIDDTAATKDAIAEATKLPMSIVIVGIGSKNFEAMQMIDSDQKELRSVQSGCAIRDIVQFVEFQQHDDEQAGLSKAKENLRTELLQEIPGQFLSYLKGCEPDHLAAMAESMPV